MERTKLYWTINYDEDYQPTPMDPDDDEFFAFAAALFGQEVADDLREVARREAAARAE